MKKQLVNKDYEVIHLLANDHAGYYPGATSINLKVIFDPKTQKILGRMFLGQLILKPIKILLPS